MTVSAFLDMLRRAREIDRERYNAPRVHVRLDVRTRTGLSAVKLGMELPEWSLMLKAGNEP